MSFGGGRVCQFVIKRTQPGAVLIEVRCGFVSASDVSNAFGSELWGTREVSANGIHLTDILLQTVAKPAAWKGKYKQAELSSLLECIGLHIEVALERFNFIPLRRIEQLFGPSNRPRHVADVQRGEELMQLSVRIGASLTASRLTRAVSGWNQIDDAAVPAPAPGAAASSGAVGGAAAGAGIVMKRGACGFFSNLKVAPVIQPVLKAPKRDQTEYEVFVMLQYAESSRTTFPKGCLQVSADGVLAKVCGELNQYFVQAPVRQGVQEMVAWLPLQADKF